MNKLVLRDLTAGYRPGVSVLAGVDFSLGSGSTLGIIGHNASGKSTLLRALAGVVPHSSGRAECAKIELLDEVPEELSARGVVSLLPQRYASFLEMTPADNVRLAVGDQLAGEFPARPYLKELVPSGMMSSSRLTGSFSGGERRRFELALAVERPAQLLLLDEPLAGIGESDSSAVLEAIVQDCRESGRICLVVEQRLSTLLAAVPRILVLRLGQVVFDGSSAEIQDAEDLAAASWGSFAK